MADDWIQHSHTLDSIGVSVLQSFVMGGHPYSRQFHFGLMCGCWPHGAGQTSDQP